MVSALAIATTASAQISIEVSPLRVELQAIAGGTSTQGITVTNTGKEPVRVRATLSDWYLSPDGSPQFETPDQTRSLSATGWTRIAPPELVLSPGDQGTVRYNLTIPKEAEAAGYRTGILFEYGPSSGEPITRGRNVQVKPRIATLIYVSVGQPAAVIDLTDLRVRTQAGQTQVVAMLNSTGKKYVRTKGTLTIYSADGKPVREVPVPDVPLLPQSEREVAIVVQDASNKLPPGDYRIEVKIDVGLPALIVGETTLKVAR
jgi:P pilus assembly chaperone PapD